MLHAPQGLHAFFRAYYHYKSADWKENKPHPLKARTAEELAKMPTYYVMDKDKGMAAWDKLLDAKQMGQLYVYVRARADKVLPPGRPDEVGPNKGKWEPADWTPK